MAANVASVYSSDRCKKELKYKMNHKDRGLALIFVHEDFEVPGKELTKRIEAAIDGSKVEECFKNLGFRTRVYANKTFLGIRGILHYVSLEDHTASDCLAVIVLTHGAKSLLYAKDSPYNENILWSSFSAEKCRTLQGKPKLFFIQACRCTNGNNYDGGVLLMQEDKLKNNEQTRTLSTAAGLNTNRSKVFQRPIEQETNYTGPPFTNAQDTEIRKDEPSTLLLDLGEDCMVAHSTCPGYVAWRSGGIHAWFIQKLCEELSSKPNDHLLIILTKINALVAFDCVSNTNCVETHQKKQMPCVTSTLSKLLFFYEN